MKRIRLPLKYTPPKVSSQQTRIDLVLLGIVTFLVAFGLLMVYDASQFEAFNDMGNKYYFFRSQLMWIALGFLALGFFSIFDYHHLKKIAFPALLVSLILLLLVFIPGLGVSAGGAHRWLKIAGFTIQPTEIIKLAAVIFLAALFEKKTKTLPFLILLGIVEIIVGVFQKDLGSAVVFGMMAFGVYFVAGAPLIHFIGLMILGGGGFVSFILMAPYRKQRVLAFLNPFADPQGYSYHISQILIALGSGGWWGLGMGQSRQKFAYIPEVTTDSIFSVVGEEFGFLGGVVLIALIGFLIWRCLKIALGAPDNFGKLLASGLAIWLGMQAVVNLASMVSLVPLTGVPLPFISYGGSALLANLVGIGILLNISKQSTLGQK
ncbi:putative lipid II flippase FtsW [Candidatus Daviesbacteria bacterium]|nr:putative lipid II flippase FtsW [Candidatus Daviesbacteria bacterium]